MNLQDKTVVLTGANGGLGQQIARQLSAAGARLILVGIGLETLEALTREMNSAKHRHSVLELDLGSRSGIQELVDYCRELPYGIDVLINGAGVNRFALIDDCDYDQINLQLEVNLIAPMVLTSLLLPLLKARKEALIVNIGSVLGSIGNPGYAAYCASKAGLARFSETLRRELADSPVKLLHLNPRVIRTAMNPEAVNRLNEKLGNKADAPEDVARILVRMIQTGSTGEHVVGWPEKLFVKINALLPSLVDRSFLKNLPHIKAAASIAGGRPASDRSGAAPPHQPLTPSRRVAS
jgi:short-subunit dehydrogenase